MSKKNKYQEMNHDELRTEYKRLNRKLILPNILIVIISVVACLMQFLMPFFQTSITLNSEVVTDVVETFYADYDDDTPIVESDNTVISKLTTKTNIKKMAAKMNSTLTIPFTATEMMSVAFASDDEAEDEVVSLLAGILEKTGIKNELESVLQAMVPTIISTYVTEEITAAITATLAEDEELTEEQTTIINNAAASIESSIEELAAAESVEEVKEKVISDVKDTVSQTMTDLKMSDEDIETVNSAIEENFDEILTYATDEETGKLSYTELLNNLDTVISIISGTSSSDDSGSSDDSDTESGETELTDEQIAAVLLLVPDETKMAILATLTADELANMTEAEQNRYIYEYYMENYASSSSSVDSTTTAIKYMLTEDSTSSSGSEEDITTVISKYITLLNNDDYEGLVREIIGEDGLDDATLQTIKTAAMYMLIFVGVTSALWAILALFALLHILLPNKKVGMWYVKLFGAAAAFVFYAIPALVVLCGGLLAPTVASLIGMDATMLTTIFGAISFSGSGLIVLICLLALWIVSIFWCHPIKKKIKKCKNALKEIS